MELQPRLFTDLPPTREETPVHQLNYPTFAGAENTMWHGRTMNSPLYGWEQDRDDNMEYPVHVGTLGAASERVLGPSSRQPARTPAGGTDLSTPAPLRSPQDFMEVAAVGHPQRGDRSQLLPFRVRDEMMFNSPDMPVSDSYANLAEGHYGEGYEETYAEELTQAGVLSDDELEKVETSIGPNLDLNDHVPEPLSMTGGLYYRNSAEDPGSISAVVPSAADLQHWPTEVMKNSTNPAQRRTAEFLLGRGY